MKQRKWYYNYGKSFEIFNILYEDGKYIVVENDNDKFISFGLKRDFNTLFGFPVNWSCLTSDEAISMLTKFVSIDKKHNINQNPWQSMIAAIQARTRN